MAVHIGSCKLTTFIARKWNNLKQSLLVRGSESKQKEKEKEKKREINYNSKWADIPEDVLEMIMKRLSLKDYVELRAVCSSWRAIVCNVIASKHCHPLPELPMIFLCSRKPTVFNLSTEGELYQKSLVLNSSKQKKNCHGTVEGWLILSELSGKDSLAISFFNPVTNATILVPPLLKFPYSIPKKMYDVDKMVASSEPISSSKSDCILVGMFIDYCHIAFCKLSHRSWTIIEAEKQVHFLDVEIIGSKLYVIVSINKSLNFLLVVYDLLKDDSSNVNNNYPPKPKTLARFPPSPDPMISEFGTKCTLSGTIVHYIAKDDASGELFLINMFCNLTYERRHVNCANIITQYVMPPNITSVEVFTMDTKKMETNNKEWKNVKDLGDTVLFLSNCKSIVMSRDALNNSTKEVNIEGNCIYFASHRTCRSDPWAGIQLGKVCLTDNSIQHFSLDKSYRRTVPMPYWFVPNV